MTERDKALALLQGEVRVVNVGLEVFYRALQSQGAKVAHVDWRPPAGGDAKLAGILDRLSGRGSKP